MSFCTRFESCQVFPLTDLTISVHTLCIFSITSTLGKICLSFSLCNCHLLALFLFPMLLMLFRVPCYWWYFRFHVTDGTSGAMLLVVLPVPCYVWYFRFHVTCGTSGSMLLVVRPVSCYWWYFRFHVTDVTSGSMLLVVLPVPCY